MANTFTPIYVLRSQCEHHQLDTMRTFTLEGNESPDEAYQQMEDWVRARWPREHDCHHNPTFTREQDKYYRYHTKKKKVVKI